MQRISCTVATCVLLLATSAVLSKPALPADSDLENDVIPHETAPVPESTDSPSSTSTEKVTSTTLVNKTDNRKPATNSDFFTRLMNDIIQIPIAALQAVGQLLNNLSARTRHVVAQAASTTTIAPVVTKS